MAVVLRPETAGSDLLLIERSRHPADPWSGDLALPGGRRDPEDADLAATARRELEEEVGLALGPPDAALDEWDARRGPRPWRMVVAPFLFLAPPEARPRCNHEVERAFFWPIARLLDPAQWTETTFERGGRTVRAPAVRVGDHALWGITLRVLADFVRLFGARLEPAR